MGISNYSELKTEIADWMDSSKLTDRIDSFIDLAEARFNREVRIRQMLRRETIGVVSRYVDLPAGFVQGSRFRLMTSPVTALTNISLEDMDRRVRDGTGTPRFYTVHSQIELDVTPVLSFSGEILFYRSLSPLSDSNITNDLLKRGADVYLWGCLAATAPFLQDDERVPLWERLYNEAKNGLNRLDSKTVGTPIATVPGVLP